MIDMVDMVMVSSGRDRGSNAMTLPIPVPKYEQFAEMVRNQIRRGELLPGDRLPSNTEYKALGWKHGTYVRGMGRLRDEGWVRGQPGEAVFVADNPPIGGTPGA
jgi:DNA-binding GntR family transcriptional regulator